MVLQWIALGIVALVVLLILYYYNRFITLRQRIENAWSQIEIQLKRRFDLIPNLIETVRGYMKHERETLESITKARAAMAKAGSVGEKARAEGLLEGALKSLFAVAEGYPQLRASENFQMLQEELSGTESKIAFARQFYNDNVMEYNTLVQSLPSNIVAGLLGYKEREYFQTEREEERKPVKVKF